MKELALEEVTEIHGRVKREMHVLRGKMKKGLENARPPGPDTYERMLILSVEMRCWLELKRALEYGLSSQQAVQRGVNQAQEWIAQLKGYAPKTDLVRAANEVRLQAARDFIYDITTEPEEE